MITQDVLKQWLDYDPETGVFRWVANAGSGNIGKKAGTVEESGYRRIRVRDQRYQANRLAWLWMTGEWPTGQVDHINGIRDDNRWVNLRDVSHSMNQQNRRNVNPATKTGWLGVTKNYTKYQARIKVNGKRISLGVFDSPEQAHAAYINGKRLLHEGCTL